MPAPGLVQCDSFRWKWSADGSFSSRGAYGVLFQGTVGLPAATLIWDSFAPFKHKMHAWLALQRRCWTTGRRLRRVCLRTPSAPSAPQWTNGLTICPCTVSTRMSFGQASSPSYGSRTSCP
ncbi:hypothetical protein QYE76_059512 [Lolium multiflorum]|uniref:Reverse transcriptase zinc-binding domain-containing protein n=1 Tax=Lolium multiflorum TaxID=4521 RepID=A0AAD8RXA9_LOLMU|nr:hypothetical protein QYE76_059512 [Lolium multiflorum]